MSLPIAELNGKDVDELEQIVLSKLRENPGSAFTFDELADLISGKFDVEKEARWSRVVSRTEVFDFIRMVYRRLSMADACLASLVAEGKVKKRSVKSPPPEQDFSALPGYITYYCLAEENGK